MSDSVNTDNHSAIWAGAPRPWLQSFTGKPIDLPVPKPGQLTIQDVAHALSLKCRFGGHCNRMYSVAEHSIRGELLLPPAFQLPFLLHELSEVALPDIPAPLKPMVFVRLDASGEMQSWAELETQHTHAILEGLNLLSIEPLIYSAEVKKMDLSMLAWEKETFMGGAISAGNGYVWKLPVPPPSDAERERWDVLLEDQGRSSDEELFLMEYWRLTR